MENEGLFETCEAAKEQIAGRSEFDSSKAALVALVLGFQGRADECDSSVRGQPVESRVQAPDFTGHDEIEWPEGQRKGDH